MDFPIDYTNVVTAAMLWDMLEPDVVPLVCEDAGVTIPDPDVAEKESAASVARRDKVMVLAPMIEVFAVIAAEIDAIVNVRASGDATVDDLEELLFLREGWEMQAYGIILPAAMAIIGQLTERNYLQVTDKARKGSLHWALPVN